ncbi:MAG: FHA domain-containing protein, partial [Planctomycetes bacterium]|nr:FHA domain-containing protein [Planctomycetota bacterium]
MLTLRVVQGPDEGKSFDVRELPVVIGRETSTGIRLNDDMASRRHAELMLRNGLLLLRDLLSTNGTFLNDDLVSEAEINPGDRIRVGRSVLAVGETQTHVRQVEAKPPTSATPPSKTVIRLAGQDTIIGERPTGAPGGIEAMMGGVVLDDADKLRQHLTTLYEVTGLISSITDIDELLNKVLDAVFGKVQADQGFIMLLDENTGQLEPKVRRRRQGGATADYTISRTIT